MTMIYQWHLQKGDERTVKIADLPLKSLIDIEGYQFILMAKNHEEHPSNSATLITRDICKNSAFSEIDNVYETSLVREYLCNDFLNLFSNKDLFLNITYKSKIYHTDITNEYHYYELTDKFVLPSLSEYGLGNDNNEGYNIGFNDDIERGATYGYNDNYENKGCWTRTATASFVDYIDPTGKNGGAKALSYDFGIRPICCISLDNTLIKPVPKLIFFSVFFGNGNRNNSMYSAEDGTTWKHWIESEFNDKGWSIDSSDNTIRRHDGRNYQYMHNADNTLVMSYDTIIPSYEYIVSRTK